jgi:hypothetical protein
MLLDMNGKQKIGILFVVLLTGFSLVGSLWNNYESFRTAPAIDPVTVHEERIAQLRNFLPREGNVGYITTVENDKIFSTERSFSNVEFLGQYVLTQYTLAPLVVRNSPDLPLVVGNFIEGGPSAGFLEEHALTPAHDLGDGLILYRREKKS